MRSLLINYLENDDLVRRVSSVGDIKGNDELQIGLSTRESGATVSARGGLPKAAATIAGGHEHGWLSKKSDRTLVRPRL